MSSDNGQKEHEAQLEKWRKQIDSIDDRLLESLNQYLRERFAVVKKIGVYKRENKLNVRAEDRRQEVIKRWQRGLGSRLLDADIKIIAEIIIEESERLER